MRSDCFVCAILTHGEEGVVYGIDDKIEVKQLLEPFKGNNCKGLVGKPKIFFIQVRLPLMLLVVFLSTGLGKQCRYRSDCTRGENYLESVYVVCSYIVLNEPRFEKKRLFAFVKTKTQISFAVTAKLISAFVFATGIVQLIYFLNLKFQASDCLQWLHSPV